MSWRKDVIFAVVDDVLDSGFDKSIELSLLTSYGDKLIATDYYLPNKFSISNLFSLAKVATERGLFNKSFDCLESFVDRYDSSLEDLREKVVCLRAAINTKSSRNEFLMRDKRESFYSQGKIFTDDWYVVELISLDMEHEVTSLFRNHNWKKDPSKVTNTPVYEYLVEVKKYQDIRLVNLDSYISYEFDGVFFHILRVESGSCKKNAEYTPIESYSNKISKSLIAVNPNSNSPNVEQKEKLSFLNIQFIFDRFFRPMRSLPVNRAQEQPLIYHFLNPELKICRYRFQESVSYRADTSRDWSVENVEIVMRIGDELSAEMQSYIRNPLEGITSL